MVLNFSNFLFIRDSSWLLIPASKSLNHCGGSSCASSSLHALGAAMLSSCWPTTSPLVSAFNFSPMVTFQGWNSAFLTSVVDPLSTQNELHYIHFQIKIILLKHPCLHRWNLDANGEQILLPTTHGKRNSALQNCSDLIKSSIGRQNFMTNSNLSLTHTSQHAS